MSIQVDLNRLFGTSVRIGLRDWRGLAATIRKAMFDVTPAYRKLERICEIGHFAMCFPAPGPLDIVRSEIDAERFGIAWFP